MDQSIVDAVTVDIVCDVVGGSLRFGTGIAHCNTEAGMRQHIHIVFAVAEHHDLIGGDAVFCRYSANTNMFAAVFRDDIMAEGRGICNAYMLKRC